jgi:nitrate reductase gamma subunit
VLRELVLFDSLWRATRLGWLLGWSFHVALLLVLVDHLWLFVETSRAWSTRLHAVSVPVGIVLLVALAGLAARRVIDARVRYVSAPSDHLHLALLGAIAATGLAMRTVAPVDLGAALAFTRGIAAGEWSSTTLDPVLVAHVTGALVLLMVFPFSKLMHAPGVLFSPTIARRDDARQLR